MWDELYMQLAEMDEQMEADGVEDATAWERWDEYEEILYIVTMHETAKKLYPRERYEADRARAIAEGTDPRCIMSYTECLAYEEFMAEEERIREWEEAYDYAMAEHESM